MICTDCGREGSRGFYFPEDGAGAKCRDRTACLRRALKRARAANAGRCVDCVSEGVSTTRKPALDRNGDPRPGNRCVTHWRAHRRSQSRKRHGAHVEKKFRISDELYWALYAAQGGRCAGCGKATGATKRLAVDHDHELAKLHDHPDDEGCPECIRCLACGVCNQILGRYDVPALARLIRILGPNPPAREFLLARR